MQTNEYRRKYNNLHYKQLKAEIKIEDYNLINAFCKKMDIKKARFIVRACKYFISKSMLPPADDADEN